MLGHVADPVIQDIGSSELEDDSRSGGLLVYFNQINVDVDADVITRVESPKNGTNFDGCSK